MKIAAQQGDVEILISVGAVARLVPIRSRKYEIQEVLDLMLEVRCSWPSRLAEAKHGIVKRAKEGSDALLSFEENELSKQPQELKEEPKMNTEKTKEEPRPKGLMKGLLAVAVSVPDLAPG